MDRQKVFDTIANGVLAQGSLGFARGGSFYRTDDGKKCGIGFLIPDALYEDGLEDCNAAQLPRHILDQINADTHDDIAFLDELQRLHDSEAAKRNPDTATALAQWRAAMRTFAARHGLADTALNDTN